MTERLDDPQRADKESDLEKALNIALAALGHFNTEQTDEHWNKQERILREIEKRMRRSARSAGTRITRRQYYYRVTACKADFSQDPECICWHDEGTGPLSVEEQKDAGSWRDAPVAQSASEQISRAAFDAAFLRAIDRQEFMVAHTPGWKSLLELVWEEIHTTDSRAQDNPASTRSHPR